MQAASPITITRPPVSTTMTPMAPGAAVRPVFTNSRQKPLPLGAGTIRGALPVPLPTVPTLIAPSSSPVAQQLVSSSQTISSMPQIISDEPDNMLTSTLPNIKNPAEVYNIPTNKQKKIAWVESQVKKDQHEAVNPNYRTAFKSKEDACKRLLRYHVFDELDTSPWELERADEVFEIKSSILIARSAQDAIPDFQMTIFLR